MKTHNTAKGGINQPGHVADNNRENTKPFDPIEEAKKNALVKKTLSLQYLSVRPGIAFLKQIEYLPKSSGGIILLDSSEVTNDEQVYQVLMVGKIDKAYDLEVKVGDMIMVAKVNGAVHLKHTMATTADGERIDGVYSCNTRDIWAVVDYKKI